MADIASKPSESNYPQDSEINKDRLELTDLVSVDKDPEEDFALMELLGEEDIWYREGNLRTSIQGSSQTNRKTSGC